MQNRRNTDTFARRLRELREKRGISQQVLADFCVISKSTIGRYENGERIPDIETAVRLADFFGVTMDYLCSGIIL